MAKFKLKTKSTAINGVISLYYQIIHNCEVRKILVTSQLRQEEWCERTSRIEIGNARESRQEYLIVLQERIRCETYLLDRVIARFDYYSNPYSVDDIVVFFNRQLSKTSLFGFMRSVIVKLKEYRRFRCSETYASTLNRLIDYRRAEDIEFRHIDSDFVEGFMSYLKNRALSRNSIVFYMKILKAVFNRAIERGLLKPQKFFKSGSTSLEKTVKRAISVEYLRRLREMDLSMRPKYAFARDMFFFSFYTRGMSFVDISHLTPANLSNGVLSYRRSKTGQTLNIKWIPVMQELVDMYHNEGSDYLFPIIVYATINGRKQYLNMLSNINRHLKLLALELEIPVNLTMYVARHSWASVARDNSVPLSIICEGMGHDSEQTTQIYLSSLETDVVDNANDLVVDTVC